MNPLMNETKKIVYHVSIKISYQKFSCKLTLKAAYCPSKYDNFLLDVENFLGYHLSFEGLKWYPGSSFTNDKVQQGNIDDPAEKKKDIERLFKVDDTWLYDSAQFGVRKVMEQRMRVVMATQNFLHVLMYSWLIAMLRLEPCPRW